MLALVLALLTFVLPDTAATPVPVAPEADRCPAAGGDAKVACAYPVARGLSVDGVLDEPAWIEARPETNFVQSQPTEGAAPSQRTEVRVLYSNAALFVGATLYDDNPDGILATLGRRDDINQADWFFVSIDSYLDRKTAYTFAVNAAGVQVDGLIREGSRGGMDTSWDAVWASEVRRTAEGWQVEMRIPYAMLRFTGEARQTWGINFQRQIARLDETVQWSLIPRNGGTQVGAYGLLQGIRDISPKRNIQVTPYTLARARSHEAEPRLFAADNRQLDVGADFKVGITSNITLDATINPDFGQVESDPQVLNLSTFETFFPERRPFFLEGVQIFDFSFSGRDGNLLYTRRIGSASAPIIGAAKLTGRTAGGFSFGVLGASTGDDFSPERSYGVLRARQDFGTQSYVGAMLTGFDRQANLDGGFGRRQSLVGGGDWEVRFKDGTYRFDGFTAFSHINVPQNDDLGIADATQQGWAGALGFDRVSGNTTFDTSLRFYSPGFNPNDIGQLRQNDFIRLSIGGQRLFNGNQPFGPFRRASSRLFLWKTISYASHTDLGYGFWLMSDWDLKNYWRLDLSLNGEGLGGYDLRETRGLWAYRNPGEWRLRTGLRSDSRRTVRFRPSLNLTYTGDGGTGYDTGLNVDWNAGSRITLSANVGYQGEASVPSWTRNERFMPFGNQWGIYDSALGDYRTYGELDGLDALLVGVDADDDGSYYVPVFGDRDRQQFDLSLRSNITFTRDLSLQLYSQLFAAKVHYDDFQLLQNPDALRPLDLPKQYDFTTNGLRFNAVMRWEYRPGSTLFVVWTQGRSGNLYPDAFDLTGTPYDRPTSTLLADTFDYYPDNVFLIKLNYLLMP